MGVLPFLIYAVAIPPFSMTTFGLTDCRADATAKGNLFGPIFQLVLRSRVRSIYQNRNTFIEDKKSLLSFF